MVKYVYFKYLFLGIIFAYGQIGIGKIFIMEGVRFVLELRGIIFNLFVYIFGYIVKVEGDIRLGFQYKCYMYQFFFFFLKIFDYDIVMQLQIVKL